MKICILKGCYRKNYSYGLCTKHHYLFIGKQEAELKYSLKKKIQVFEDKEEYPPIKFKTDIDIYKLQS